jgi:hypothetical protein
MTSHAPLYLFVFGYESPSDRAINDATGADHESSAAVWVTAESEVDALEKGRQYAQDYVRNLYIEAGQKTLPDWLLDGYAHWISHNPSEEYPTVKLDVLPRI